MIKTAATITTMVAPTFTAMILAHMVIIKLQDMSILNVTMNTDIHTTTCMATTSSIVMRRTIIATAITDTVIPICPPALTGNR